MTKHKFVKLVWNMNDRIWQKSAGNRLFRAAYTPIDRRLFGWCLKRAPLFSLISSIGGGIMELKREWMGTFGRTPRVGSGTDVLRQKRVRQNPQDCAGNAYL